MTPEGEGPEARLGTSTWETESSGEKVKFQSRLMLWMLPFVWVDATALDASNGVKVTPLVKETTNWDGEPIVYPKGKAEMTAVHVEIAPGAQTGWHCHMVPNFAYMLEGTLDLTLDDGRVKRLKAGEALAEVVKRSHNGRNVGSTPARLIVFYAGAVGSPLSVEGKECSPAPTAMGRSDYKAPKQ